MRSANQITRLDNKEIQNKNKWLQWVLGEGGPLRAVQFFSKTEQKRVNSVQKEETNQAFSLVNYQRNLQMANQMFCFQIKRTPWMAQLMA